MSLVTTCPECNTAFVVKPEHLSAHRGDVRCGQCQHLFNALAHLTETSPVAKVPAPASEPDFDADPDSDSEASPPADQPAAPPVADDAVMDFETPNPDPVIESDSQRMNDGAPETLETDEPGFPALADPELAMAQPATVPEAEPAPAPATKTPETDVPAPIQPDPEPAPPEPVLAPTPRINGLESTSGKAAFLSRPSPVRRGISPWQSTGVLLLLLAAAAQTAYFSRTEIAMRLPQTKPWLAKACTFIGCTVELPRQIDLLVIDDSNLQEDTEHEGVVLLTSTLLNHAHFAQAYPQLELTLTDLNDHAVLRRTFAPAEYLAKGADIAPGMPADGEIHIKLALSIDQVKAAGYRVYLNYP